MSMAMALIDQLTGPFEPEAYNDEYRVALERVIESKLVGGKPVVAAPVAAKGKVGDLMDALKASIEATKTERSGRKGKAVAEAKPKKAAIPRKANSKVSA